VQLYNPDFKGGVVLNYFDLKEQAKITNGAILEVILPEPFRDQLCGLGLLGVDPASNFDLFNNFTMRLFEAGIVQHWMDETNKYLDPNYYKKPLLFTKEYLHEIYPKTHPHGAQKLTLNQLEAGFVIYLAAVALCLVVFLLEWLVRLKDYFVAYHLLSAYFNEKVRENRLTETQEIKSILKNENTTKSLLKRSEEAFSQSEVDEISHSRKSTHDTYVYDLEDLLE
jgi:hypothetical protein